MTSSTASDIARAARKHLKTTWYAREVVAGKIVAGKKVRQACQRHLDDLERSQDPAWPWRFDEAKAYRWILYAEKYCRPSQGVMDRIELQPWDHFVWGSIHGWVHKETGLRRFRYALIFVARKNGKSLKVSVEANFAASKDGERGAKVYLLANTMKQVREAIFDECKRMVSYSPALSKRFKVTRDLISYNTSEIKPQASDSRRLDSLNTSRGIFDEIHEYKNYKLINVIENSTGARLQPLIVYITTAGYVLDGPLMDMYEQGTDVLNGVIKSDRFFYYLAEIDESDDIEDISCWPKANPNLGVSIQLEDLIEKWEKDKHVPAQRNDFITKRLNVFVDSGEESFVPLEVLRRNEGMLDIELLKGRPCVAGYDLSDTEDFTSACLEFPLSSELLAEASGLWTAPDDWIVPEAASFILSHSWVPEAKVKRDNEKIDYSGWEEAGLLTVCKGETVDHSLVLEWLLEQARLYTLLTVAYDPKSAFRLNEELKRHGGDEWIQPIRQGHLTLGDPLKDIKAMLVGGRTITNCDPMLRWYMNNIRLERDRNNNWMPKKQDRYRKIDGFSAWLTAHAVTITLPPPPDTSKAPVTFISRRELSE